MDLWWKRVAILIAAASLTLLFSFGFSSSSFRVIDQHHIEFNGEIYSKSRFSTLNISEAGEVHKTGGWLAFYAFTSFFLVCFAGLMSGLTVGLFSIDPLKLELQKRQGTPDEKRKAQKLEPILRQHHFLLCTLLLSNAAAMEALPLFLDEIVPSWAAILLSVSFVLIFGEVIPQALCTKDPLTIGAFFAWIVRFLMFVLAPIAYPLSKILDYVIGHDEAKVFFKRSELKTLIDMHLKPEAGPFHLTKDEGLILQGALNLKEKRVSQAMIPESEAFMVEHDFELNVENIKKIVRSGFSRIPVYQGRRNNIKGMLLVKQLLLVEPDHGFKVKDLTLRLPLLVLPNAPLHEILNKFQEGHSHLALVYSNVEMVKTCLDTRKDVPEDDHLLGLITIEDIMEELIQEEIADELDIDIDHLKSRISSGPNIPKFKGSLSKQIRVARSRSASLILEEMKRSPNMLLDSPRIAALKPTLGYLRLGDSVP